VKYRAKILEMPTPSSARTCHLHSCCGHAWHLLLKQKFSLKRTTNTGNLIYKVDTKIQQKIQGTWIATSINENLLFGRYQSGGHFAPHTDGCTTIDFNHRSMYSIILYLNHCERGGRTHLYEDDQLSNLVLTPEGYYSGDPKYLIDTVLPARGSALVFYHAIVHEGEPIGEEARKYIIRTDVMYKRENPICNSPKDVEAFRMYEKAKEMTNEGNPEEAIILFRRAFKMSPALAEVFHM